MVVISRNNAKQLKLLHYFTGIPCKQGHISKRYTSTKGCLKCLAISNRTATRKYVVKNNEKSIRRETLREEARVQGLSMYFTGETCRYGHLAERYVKDKCCSVCYKKRKREWYTHKYRTNLGFRLSRCVSSGINRTIKKGKENKSWKNFVPYTLKDLKKHLQAKFTDKMNWENYGHYWHIDHVRPISWFNLDNKEEFNKCWALTNLQPLEASLNISKNNRYEG